MGRALDSQVLDLFRQQAGVVTAAQAMALGMSRRQIHYRLETLQWEELRRGVYHHPLFPDGPEMWLHAVTLSGWGFVSHRYAARLHRLEPFDRAAPEASVRRLSFSRTPGIKLHETTQLRTANVVMIDGYPVSGVERTIMDLAAVEPAQWRVLSAIDSALRAGKTDPERLEACLRTHAKRGRNGTVRFRSALNRLAGSQGVPIGHASRRAASLLATSGIPYPTFEGRVFVGGEFISQVDLAWSVPLVGYLDGFTHHGAKRFQNNRDRYQRQTLRNAGLVVVEFTNDQLSQPGFVSHSCKVGYREAAAKLREHPDRYRNWATKLSL